MPPLPPPPQAHYRLKQLIAFGWAPSRATWLRWVREGKAPEGLLLGPGCRVWPQDQIDAFLASRPTGRRRRGATATAAEAASP